MMKNIESHGILLTVLLVSLLVSGCARTQDPLPSWADGPTRTAIIDFVQAVTEEGGADYVPPAERIATFDNDGTLWVEYPLYTQFLFGFDRVKELAPQHPEWQTTQPFKAVLEDDLAGVAATGVQGLMDVSLATHAGMTAEAFSELAHDWITTTLHPRFDRPFVECVYQPQLELLAYLRANGFKTFISSGGGMAFMRPITEEAYGIPPEQVVGSSVVAAYEIVDGEPTLVRKPEINFINDKADKPVGIYQHIGRRPILAFGNSEGDRQMIEFTTTGGGRRLGLFLHHTDAEREYAYDREGHIGVLNQSLDQAEEKGWIIVDMKNDWKTVFPSP